MLNARRTFKGSGDDKIVHLRRPIGSSVGERTLDTNACEIFLDIFIVLGLGRQPAPFRGGFDLILVVECWSGKVNVVISVFCCGAFGTVSMYRIRDTCVSTDTIT